MFTRWFTRLGLGFCGWWHFLFTGQTAGVCQVTGQAVLRAHTSCDAKSFCASLYHCSSYDVVDLEKAHWKDVYKTAFSRAYYSGDISLALLQAVPRVWNLDSGESSVQPMVSCHVWPLICLYQYQYQSPRGELPIPIFSSSSHLLSSTSLHLMQTHAWILCSISLWTAWILCIQSTLGLHKY